ncbi:MAG: hypothetical protein KF767_11870 [Bdellovibrionaceae bacterium]|nr:hypothetical protein [Pseudobdellovibrionaceae bacterium]
MSDSDSTVNTAQLLHEVSAFVGQAQGLSFIEADGGRMQVTQSVDGKCFRFNPQDLSEVVHRFDTDGKVFIQVNFKSGLKVLLTENLVGFKPEQVMGLDMTKLPKVVTTPDLVSVLEAIEETLSSDSLVEHELEILKRVYHAILKGGELAGFDLHFERRWLERLTPSAFRASA